jgi:group I intron endonuclease
MAKIGVYKIYFENDKNNKVYVGISNNLTRRKTDHLNNLLENCHKNKFLQNAYKKYGVENFKFEILETCDINFLVSKEEEYIKKFNSFNNRYGYNLTSGGEHKKLSESTKKKLSKVKSGNKLSDKTKTKLVIHNLLKNRPELKIDVIDGKIFVEGKEYIKSKKGKFRTPQDDIKYKERRKEISKRQSEFAKKLGTNRVKSQEEIEKIRLANLGNKHTLGKKLSEKHKQIIKEKLGFNTTLITPDNTTHTFKSITDCSKYLGCSESWVRKNIIRNRRVKGCVINATNSKSILYK